MRCARNARADARAGRRAADPHRLEVSALDRGAAPDPRARSRVSRRARVHRCPRRSTSPSRASRTSSSPTRRSTAGRSPRSRAWRPSDPARAPVLMVDDRPHLDLIEGAIGGGPALGPRLPRHRRRLVAARRAHGADRAEALARRTMPRRARGWPRRSPSAPGPSSRADGLRGADRRGRRRRSRASRCEAPRSARCSRASERDIRGAAARRSSPRCASARRGRRPSSSSSTAAAREASRAPRPPGSSPSSPPARASTPRPSSTPTARSTSTPAAFFCLPVVRRPRRGVATAARRRLHRLRAAPTRDRLPEPYLPGGLRFDCHEGAGEVQTPAARRGGATSCASATASTCATRRRASSASASTRLVLVEGEGIVDEVPTYRGEGKAFL